VMGLICRQAARAGKQASAMHVVYG
jgi:hypothetical protein